MREGRDFDRQLTLRLGTAELERLDRLAHAIAANTPGVDVSRSSAARAALLAGLDALEQRLAASATKKPKR